MHITTLLNVLMPTPNNKVFDTSAAELIKCGHFLYSYLMSIIRTVITFHRHYLTGVAALSPWP